MTFRFLSLCLALLILSACATTHDDETHPNQQQDLYNSNKTVQQPQAHAWGWLSN